MLEAKPDESDEAFRKRRRHKLRVIGSTAILIVLLGGMLVFLVLHATAKVGERCDTESPCEEGAWCLLDGVNYGTCVKTCEPNQIDACPAGTRCLPFQIADKDLYAVGPTFACEPKR